MELIMEKDSSYELLLAIKDILENGPNQTIEDPIILESGYFEVSKNGVFKITTDGHYYNDLTILSSVRNEDVDFSSLEDKYIGSMRLLNISDFNKLPSSTKIGHMFINLPLDESLNDMTTLHSPYYSLHIGGNFSNTELVNSQLDKIANIIETPTFIGETEISIPSMLSVPADILTKFENKGYKIERD